MGLCVVEYDYSPESADDRSQVRPDHAAYLAGLAQDGKMILSGPYTDGTGALFLVRAESEEDCQTCFDADPFWTAGLVAGRRFHRFLLGFGLPDETDRVVRPAVSS